VTYPAYVAACPEGDLCPCDDCARLDLDYPGEGRQLALSPLFLAYDGDRPTAALIAGLEPEPAL
jgi:hypothetical protein